MLEVFEAYQQSQVSSFDRKCPRSPDSFKNVVTLSRKPVYLVPRLPHGPFASP